MKFLIIIQTIYALSNTVSQAPGGNADPLYLFGMERLYPTSPFNVGGKTLPALVPGVALPIFLRFTRMEDIQRTFTSVYFPRTDQYSALVVPNSTEFLIKRLAFIEYLCSSRRSYKLIADSVLRWPLL